MAMNVFILNDELDDLDESDELDEPDAPFSHSFSTFKSHLDSFQIHPPRCPLSFAP